MKKNLALIIVFTLFILILIVGCTSSETPVSVVVITINPSAEPLLETMTVIARTVESIGQTATEYAATLTPTQTASSTPTPTKIPDPGKVKEILNKAIKNELRNAMDTDMQVDEVIFRPEEAPPFTELEIRMTCDHQGDQECDPIRVFVELVNACKKKNDALDYISNAPQIMWVSITTENNRTWTAYANWVDVIAFKKMRFL